jgi:ABC-2 type transport system permease protein
MNDAVQPKGNADPGKQERVMHPFWVIVQKEISDHVRSWRFIFLIAIIALTCIGAMYTALSNISDAVRDSDSEGNFLFLLLFTVSDENLPSFFVFIGFLGPLLGISLGFDAVNSEQNRGTIGRILAQPIHRDNLINAKFVASLAVISTMFFALGFLVMGIGLFSIGIPPTPEEFLRIVFFILLSIIYVAFWLGLSILFSVRFRQPATSALSGIAVWLFCTVFYNLIVNLIVSVVSSSKATFTFRSLNTDALEISLLRILPNQLFSEATTTLLMPSVRSLGPLTMEQLYGTIPAPLPLGQSLMLVWPQVTGLISITVLCFAISYLSFMKREIRPR